MEYPYISKLIDGIIHTENIIFNIAFADKRAYIFQKTVAILQRRIGMGVNTKSPELAGETGSELHPRVKQEHPEYLRLVEIGRRLDSAVRELDDRTLHSSTDVHAALRVLLSSLSMSSVSVVAIERPNPDRVFHIEKCDGRFHIYILVAEQGEDRFLAVQFYDRQNLRGH
jgi:hypothetical protein